jgi:hypothetical protein
MTVRDDVGFTTAELGFQLGALDRPLMIDLRPMRM